MKKNRITKEHAKSMLIDNMPKGNKIYAVHRKRSNGQDDVYDFYDLYYIQPDGGYNMTRFVSAALGDGFPEFKTGMRVGGWGMCKMDYMAELLSYALGKKVEMEELPCNY